MYLCYKVTVLTNELFRLKKERKRKMERKKKEKKKVEKKSTCIQINPGREYYEHTNNFTKQKGPIINSPLKSKLYIHVPLLQSRGLGQ